MTKTYPQTCKLCGTHFQKTRKVQPFCSLTCHFWFKAPTLGSDECWPWNGTRNSDGYGIISDNHRTLLAHRISAMIAGEYIDGMVVMHSCDNPACVNPKHLSCGTQADNVKDCVDKGRRRYGNKPTRGGDSHLSKLTQADVLAIRAMYAEGMRQSAIARKYPHVTHGAIWRIVHRRTWQHI